MDRPMGAGQWRLRLREHVDRLRLTGVMVGVLALAAAVWSVQSWLASPVRHEPHLTIAVLPFANVGEQSDEDWLGVFMAHIVSNQDVGKPLMPWDDPEVAGHATVPLQSGAVLLNRCSWRTLSPIRTWESR